MPFSLPRRAGADEANCPGISFGDVGFQAHKLLALAHIPVIENLTGLDRLPWKGFTVVVAPLKIQGGSGSPARVFAILEERAGS